MNQHNSCKSPDVKKNPSKTSQNRKTNIGNQNNNNNNNKQSNNNNNNGGSKEQVCDICAQNVPGPERQEIFAFGKCDHSVCYVCSARLRVICDQSDCPICREKLEYVIFSSDRKTCYEKNNLKNCLFNAKYKIYFDKKTSADAFDKLLRYECLKCLESGKLAASRKNNIRSNRDGNQLKSNSAHGNVSPSKDKQQTTRHGNNQQVEAQPEPQDCNKATAQSDPANQRDTRQSTDMSNPIDRIEDDAQGLLKSSDVASSVFNDVFGLKNHLNYVHRLKLCDLCLTHNNLFPFEYSYYDQAALRKHMKDGEPKTSHRGHPNCALCHETFFNTDELIQHMSREHYHCHLCGRHDSNMRIYFLDYNSLRDHFRAKHFLCERENCRHEQFTSAFDNEIDYKTHLVRVHDVTSGQSRGEARHHRTITLDPAPHRSRAMSPSLSSRRNLPPNSVLVSTGNIATANSARHQRPESNLTQIRQQRLPTSAEFPALGNNPRANSSKNTTQTMPVTYTNQYPSLLQATNNRPTPTMASSSSSLSQRMVAGPSSSRGSFVRSAGGGYRAAEELNEMDFPPLPEQPKAKSKKKPKANQTTTTSSNTRNDGGALTLDQLISASLTLSNRNTKFNGKKSGSKAGSSKASKNMKQKSLKIQLS